MTHEHVLMQRSLNDISSLIYEVESKYFIPKRFRKAPFTDALRTEYVAYLREVAEELDFRLKGGVVVRPVLSPASATSAATYKVIIRPVGETS